MINIARNDIPDTLSEEDMPKLYGYDLDATLPGATITLHSDYHLTYHYQQYAIAFVRLHERSEVDVTRAVLVKYNGHVWVTASLQDAQQWLEMFRITS